MLRSSFSKQFASPPGPRGHAEEGRKWWDFIQHCYPPRAPASPAVNAVSLRADDVRSPRSLLITMLQLSWNSRGTRPDTERYAATCQAPGKQGRTNPEVRAQSAASDIVSGVLAGARNARSQ